MKHTGIRANRLTTHEFWRGRFYAWYARPGQRVLKAALGDGSKANYVATALAALVYFGVVV